MTSYNREDLDDDWEFKIVRSNTASFKDHSTLLQLFSEEKRFGWIFLEKFDDYRIRFKRKKSSVMNANGGDPYRTIYGMSTGKFTALVISLVLLGTFAFILIFMAIIFGLNK